MNVENDRRRPRRKRVLRWLGWSAGVLVTLAVAGFAWLFWFGGIAISDRTMLWRMLREEGVPPPSAATIAQQLRVREGYRVSLYATGLPSARLMVVTAAGDLLVTQPRGGLVTLLAADRDGDGLPDARRTLYAGLDRPNGIDLAGEWLYVAEATRVFRVRFDAARGALAGEPQTLIAGLTADGAHWRKTVRIGPDGALYLGQGSTCNVCLERDARRATMMRFAADGSGGEIFATGLRNPYGFDWAPWDGALYATENGRDLLGDDLPPDELNRLERGGFYGWPYVHGNGLRDPEFGARPEAAARIAAARAPAFAFRAHNAPLGIRFLRHGGEAGARRALVALHGSWNRSVPDGYAVVELEFRNDGSIVSRPFLDGFRGAAGLIGRPVDVVEAPDGSIFVSDDYSGSIYRIQPPAARATRAPEQDAAA